RHGDAVGHRLRAVQRPGVERLLPGTARDPVPLRMSRAVARMVGVAGVIAGLAGCAPELPARWTLTQPGITVEVTRRPYGVRVRDGGGRLVLQSDAPGELDGYGALGWTSGRADYAPLATVGYLQFAAALDP